jgi:uncharacterized protein
VAGGGGGRGALAGATRAGILTAGRTRIVVVADTHLRARPARGRSRTAVLDRLPVAAHVELERADLVLHAGDVVEGAVLDAFGAVAPTYAVLGNNDGSLVGVLPETRTLDVGGLVIAMIHDSGPSRGRAARLGRRFPDAAVVVYGHSHVPEDVLGVEGQRLFNPGSPTQRRAQPRHTLGVLEVGEGQVLAHRIVALD